MRVAVYVPAQAREALEAAGFDPAEFVRDSARRAWEQVVISSGAPAIAGQQGAGSALSSKREVKPDWKPTSQKKGRR